MELTLILFMLGVLIIFAMPRFIETGTSSNNNKVKATATQLQTAIQAAHQKWLMQGGGDAVTMSDGAVVSITSTGWPGSTSNTNASCAALWDDLLQVHAPVQEWQYFSGKASNRYLAYGSGTYCLYLHLGQIDKGVYRYLYVNSATGEIKTSLDFTLVPPLPTV